MIELKLLMRKCLHQYNIFVSCFYVSRMVLCRIITEKCDFDPTFGIDLSNCGIVHANHATSVLKMASSWCKHRQEI